MKKVILLMLLCVATFNVNAQSVDFRITPDGFFQTSHNTNYEVVQYSGKSAHEIFKVLFTNVGNVYRTIKSKAILTIDGSSITVRAYNNKLSYGSDSNAQDWLGSYYNLVFEIKDGKVKVLAPDVDQVMQNGSGVREKDFSKMAKGFFDENGKVILKKQDQKVYTEYQMNKILNAVLSGNYEDENDW